MELFALTSMTIIDELAKAPVPGVFGWLNCNHLNGGVR